MRAKLLDGAALARRILKGLGPRIAAVKRARGRAPGLAVLAVGPSGASETYLHAQIKACREAGLEADVHALPAKTTQAEAARRLSALGRDAEVDAIILDLPLPAHLSASALVAALPPEKDAEGVTPENFGRLFAAKSYEEIRRGGLVAPPTALAIAELARAALPTLAGRRAVVVGRSSIVGKPAAHLLAALDATVTLCHSRTRDLREEVRRADIVVAAMGRPGLIKAAWIKRGAVVIDAGINRTKAGIRGDVEGPGAAARITPVPGGVGPVTTALLLANAVLLAEKALRP